MNGRASAVMRKNSWMPTQAKPIIATANNSPPTIAIVTTIAIQGNAQAIRASVSEIRGGLPSSPPEPRRRRRRERFAGSGGGSAGRFRRA